MSSAATGPAPTPGKDEPIKGEVYKLKDKDYTFFVEAPGDRGERIEAQLALSLRSSDGINLSNDCSVTIEDDSGKRLTGRVLACYCCAGKYISLSVRYDDDAVGTYHRCTTELQESTWTADRGYSSDFLNSRADCCDSLYDSIIAATQDLGVAPQGLIVITGPTGTGKSAVARGIVDRCLRDEFDIGKLSVTHGRRPHLITYEEPIETPYRLKNSDYPHLCDPCQIQKYGLDYTPRQAGDDVNSLKKFTEDALRQKPAVVFVGETRNRKEWEVLLNFAAAGHLVVTTAHAGSWLRRWPTFSKP